MRFAQLREEARIHEADEQVAAIRKGLHSVIPLKDLVWFSALDVCLVLLTAFFTFCILPFLLLSC